MKKDDQSYSPSSEQERSQHLDQTIGEQALANCCRSLFMGQLTRETLARAIEPIRQFFNASRMYVFECFQDRYNGTCIRQLAEVCAEGISATIEDPTFQCFPLRNGFARWEPAIKSGQVVKGPVSSFPEEERRVFGFQGILSLLCVPFKVNDEYSAFVGLDDCVSAREWGDSEITYLTEVGSAVAHFLERQSTESRPRLETQLRHSGFREKEARSGSKMSDVFKFIFDQSPLGGATIKLDLRFLNVNAELCRITGYKADEFNNLNLSSLVVKGSWPKIEEKMLALNAQQVQQVELEASFVHRRDLPIIVFLSMSLVRDNDDKPLYYVMFVRDITVQKMVERRLADSEERHRLLFESSGLGIAYFDLSGRLLLINKRAARYLGGAPEEFVGKMGPELSPRLRDIFVKRFEEVRSSGARKEYEDYFEFPHGVKRWVLLIFQPVRDRDKRMTGIQVLVRDITQRKISDEKIEKQRLELEHHNITLRNILTQIESEKNLIRESVALNIERNVKPLTRKLRRMIEGGASVSNLVKYVGSVENYLDEINDDFFRRMENLRYCLTPHEIRICYLVKAGYATKEIADMMDVSPNTIKNHLANVRKKLGIVNKRVGLKSYFNRLGT